MNNNISIEPTPFAVSKYFSGNYNGHEFTLWVSYDEHDNFSWEVEWIDTTPKVEDVYDIEESIIEHFNSL